MIEYTGKEYGGYLEGQLLVATPNITGSSFKKSVILICAHSSEGAMGLIINHTLENVTHGDLFEQLNITDKSNTSHLPVYYGGPVEINRGFVVYEHKGKHLDEAMLTVDNISISGSVGLLQEIAEGQGPKRCLMALGYAGWSPGQLEEEIEDNSWISVPLSSNLIFDGDVSTKWERAAMMQGVDLTKLSTTAGHA